LKSPHSSHDGDEEEKKSPKRPDENRQNDKKCSSNVANVSEAIKSENVSEDTGKRREKKLEAKFSRG
jgi:hypothetical protein